MDSVKRAAIFFIAFPPSTDIGPQKEIMGLSSAAARCGLYTASRTGFSSNRQLSVLPALNAYKPTLHVLFFCFVSHYNSAACNIQFIFQENLSWSAQLSKKESCEAGFSACGGSRKRHSTIPPQCDPRGAFLSYGNEVSYTIKKGRICFPIRPFQIKFYFPLILLTPRTGCYIASHKNRSVQAASRGCPAR